MFSYLFQLRIGHDRIGSDQIGSNRIESDRICSKMSTTVPSNGGALYTRRLYFSIAYFFVVCCCRPLFLARSAIIDPTRIRGCARDHVFSLLCVCVCFFSPPFVFGFFHFVFVLFFLFLLSFFYFLFSFLPVL